MEKILLMQAEEKEKICKLAARMRIRVIQVTVEEYKKTLGQLADSKETQKEMRVETAETKENVYGGEAPEGSLIVFCDLSEKHLDKLLFQLRSQKLSVTYKATLTPTNRNWNVLRMYAEMEREKKNLEI